MDFGERAGFHPPGGLIFNAARQIPKTGETFCWHGVHFEVVGKDDNGIAKVLVVPECQEEGDK